MTRKACKKIGEKAGRHSRACVAASLVLAFSLAASGIGYATYEAIRLPDVVSAQEKATGKKEDSGSKASAKALESAVTSAVKGSAPSEYGLSKEETVYLFADENGTVKQTIVSDWLKNGDGEDLIKDSSSLSEIENVKGDEKFTQNGEEITWEAGGNDIYYQGKSEKKSPVGVNITYMLDGKEMSAEEIAGKSGKVTIRFDYDNNAKVKVGKHRYTVPFTMVTGLFMPTDTFSNIEVSNGQVLSEGNNQIALGFAFPGLYESIDGDEFVTSIKDLTKRERKLDIPDYVEVTADATDFSLDMTMTLALPDVLSQAIRTQNLGLDDLNERIDELSEGIDELSDGTEQLADGADQLADGTGQLADGSSQLADGADRLADGSGTLAGGAGRLNANSHKLVSGAAALYSGANGDLKKGASKLADGLGTLDEKLGESGDSLKELQSSGEGVNEFADGAGQVADGTVELVDSMGKIQSSLSSSVEELRAQQSELGGQVAQAEAAVSQLEGTVSQLESADVKNFKTPEEMQGYVSNLIAAEQGLAQARGQLGQAQGAYSAVSQSLDKLSGSVGEMSGSEDKLARLKEGAGSISKNAESIKRYTAGTNSLIQSMASLKKPINQLAAGATNLSNGISKGDDSLIAGASQLLDGVESYTDGVGALYDGASALAEGSGTLADGAGSLADGAGRLDDGAGKLADGSGELMAGVDELTSTIDTSKINDSLERLQNVNKAGKKYTSFSGSSDDEKGKVRFVIKTDGVKAE